MADLDMDALVREAVSYSAWEPSDSREDIARAILTAVLPMALAEPREALSGANSRRPAMGDWQPPAKTGPVIVGVDCGKPDGDKSVMTEMQRLPNGDWIILSSGQVIEGEVMGDWQPIKTAPKDGRRILLFAQGSHGPLDVYYGVGQWAEADPDLTWTGSGWFWEFAIRPTHWQPLPAPPEASP